MFAYIKKSKYCIIHTLLQVLAHGISLTRIQMKENRLLYIKEPPN